MQLLLTFVVDKLYTVAMEKIKIRISSFALLIIENDALRFGYIKSDNSPNKNGLLNKLIPNLIAIRKLRREKIRQLLTDMGNSRTEEIYAAVNQVIDEVYFYNADLRTLDQDIWILPTRQAETAFDEIYESEIAITALSATEYIRGLLNEYALLPQYKREEFAFYNEFDIIQTACCVGQILHFDYDGEKYKFFPFQHMFGFLYDQTNYLIGYDMQRKQIRSLPIAGLTRLYMLKSKYRPSNALINALQSYLNEAQYSADNIVDFVDSYENQ